MGSWAAQGRGGVMVRAGKGEMKGGGKGSEGG